ncbi:hypothetical protein ABGB06_26695 [Streptomyces sp. B6B3]
MSGGLVSGGLVGAGCIPRSLGGWLRTRRLVTALALGTLVAGVAGCGIRSTEVPVDGGPAPTRASCDAPAAHNGTEVYLVCGSQVESVVRAVDLPPGKDGPVEVANELLLELKSNPAEEEQAAGFRTEVPANLWVTGGAGDSESPVIRLSQGPGQLPVSALVQIICTFARNEVLGNGHSVMLSGPPASPSSTPKTYLCSATVRESPEAASHEPADDENPSGEPVTDETPTGED